MNKLIIYLKDEGGIAIINPAIGSQLTIEQIAKNYVPQGKRYGIVNVEDLPSDRTFRNAWEIDKSLLLYQN